MLLLGAPISSRTRAAGRWGVGAQGRGGCAGGEEGEEVLRSLILHMYHAGLDWAGGSHGGRVASVVLSWVRCVRSKQKRKVMRIVIQRGMFTYYLPGDL